jgi:FkbM family methyltransferase
LAEAAGGARAPDIKMRMRYADCLLALGQIDAAKKNYLALIAEDSGFLPAHTALLYLSIMDQPALVAATNLPLRLRKIYGFPMLVWHAFPDLAMQMQQQPYFNRLLGFVAKALFKQYPDLTVLDIGANIGQSVAEIQSHVPAPCLSIECGPQNFALTQYNTQRLHPKNKALHALVGMSGQYGKMTYVRTFQDFDHLVPPEWIQPDRAASTDSHAVAAAPLSELLTKAPEFANSRLVKMDAEGWDWDIIIDNAWFWQKNQPWLFYENNPEFFSDWQQSQAMSAKAMQCLLDAGYKNFLMFDNDGRYLGQITDQHLQRLYELNAFHTLHRRTGGCIGHYDILAVPPGETHLIAGVLAAMYPQDLYGKA